MGVIDSAIAYFKGQGWTDAQAAGIVGNLAYESGGLNASAVGDNGAAYGIAQWHSDRAAMFQNVIGKPLKGSTLQDQLQFVQWELTHTESYAANQLKRTNTIADATRAFMSHFERPANASSYNDRLDAANKAALGGAQGVADASVSNGWNWGTGALTDWLNSKLSAAGSWLGSKAIAVIIGIVGFLVILFGLWQLIKDPVGQAKSTVSSIAMKAALAA